MNENNMPASIKRVLLELKALLDDQTKLGLFVGKQAQELSRADYVVVAAINRSLYLSAGLAEMIKTGNRLCAVPLLRLQMDSVMRIKAMIEAENPEDIARHIWKGEPFNKLRSKDGNRLTDLYLHAEVSKDCRYFSETYNDASEFIHLSHKHVFDQVGNLDEVARCVTFFVGPPVAGGWDEKDMLLCVTNYLEISSLLNDYCIRWVKIKSEYPTQLDKMET